MNIHTTLKATLKFLSVLCFLCLTAQAQAVIQQHSFTITSVGTGETGFGTFTWDDVTVPNNSPLSTGGPVSPNILSLSITILGGNVIGGGTTTFSLANCTAAFTTNTPNFLLSLTFSCNNGTDNIVASSPGNATLNGGPSELAFIQGATAPLVVGGGAGGAETAPTLSEWMLILLALVLGGIGYTAAMKTRKN